MPDGTSGCNERPVSLSLPVSVIRGASGPLCYIVRGSPLPDETTFVTPAAATLQAGYVVHPAGYEIAPHTHRHTERRIMNTGEVLVVLRGRCVVDVYDDDRRCVASETLSQGDVLVMVSGGHGFRMIEDTVLFEVKQGPYLGPDEKETFG